MPKKIKSFGYAGDTPPKGRPSIPIELNGKVFQLKGQVPGTRLLGMMRAMDDDLDDGQNPGTVLWSFLTTSFTQECREDAIKWLEESDPPIDFPQIMDIVAWMVEQYTGNPTESPEQSEAGSATDGPGSTEKPSSPELTSETSTPTSSSSQEPPTPAETSS